MGVEPSWVQLAAAPLLFFMMLVVGLELSVEDFRRVARVPRAVLIGTAGQLILLPIMTWALVAVLDPTPLAAGGLVLVLAAPGGGISNVFTMLAGGNIALSVTLTAFASVLAVVTMPAISSLAFSHVLGESAVIEVPMAPMVGQLAALVLLPISIGMAIRARFSEGAARLGPRLRQAVLAGAVLVIVLGVGSSDGGIVQEMGAGLGLALLWSVLAMTLGYGVGFAIGLEESDAFTLAIEFAVKNVALSALVAMAALGRPELAIFTGAYVAMGYPLAVGLSLLHRRRVRTSSPS
jgi:BASS family bile acid:Na+ symporter